MDGWDVQPCSGLSLSLSLHLSCLSCPVCPVLSALSALSLSCLQKHPFLLSPPPPPPRSPEPFAHTHTPLLLLVIILLCAAWLHSLCVLKNPIVRDSLKRVRARLRMLGHPFPGYLASRACPSFVGSAKDTSSLPFSLFRGPLLRSVENWGVLPSPLWTLSCPRFPSSIASNRPCCCCCCC
ncbi:MAG: hypothetical protein J3Q66DRAFT_336178, partial [Benniella sp.]